MHRNALSQKTPSDCLIMGSGIPITPNNQWINVPTVLRVPGTGADMVYTNTTTFDSGAQFHRVRVSDQP